MVLELRAPAKLTLSLRVAGVRADGYHLIDAEMVTLELADTLRVDDGGTNVLPANDLVSRALVAVGRSAHVAVDKRIPVGAGLGGGSADAAAILRWAGCRDLAVAASIGADVPFCMVGGRARVRGIGEVVEPLPFSEVEGRAFTLLTPPLHVSKPAVYAQWDAMGGLSDPAGVNDLAPAALAVFPELASWRGRLGDATGLTPRLAGSGGTWFVEGAFPDCRVPGAALCAVTEVSPPL